MVLLFMNFHNNSGFGMTKSVAGLESSTEFFFRLIVVSPKKVESEPSERVSAITESMSTYYLKLFLYFKYFFNLVAF